MSRITSLGTSLIRLLISACVLLSALAVSRAVDLNGAGATFPFPLYSKWFSVYEAKGARINYQSIGSGGGIKQLQAGTVDFGASDAPLSDEEMKTMPAPVVHIPTVAGAVAVVYNVPGVGKGLRLTGDVLAAMFLGEITKWNDKRITALNPKAKLPNLPIIIAHRSDGSGTSYIFTNYLVAVSPAWKTKVGAGKSVNWPVGLGGKGNEGVAGTVMKMPGALGYVELAYALQNKMTYAFMKNKAGAFVEPTVASTTAAAAGSVAAMKKDVRVSIVNAAGKTAYPIAGFTYILLYKNQPDLTKGKTLVNFLLWAIKDGQSYAAKLEYAPLPKEVVKINEAALKKITSGGKAILK
ncbi:MAG: phosphate ABC transporter substrate-binding protein PstS [Armatimonadota bacterium]